MSIGFEIFLVGVDLCIVNLLFCGLLIGLKNLLMIVFVLEELFLLI